MNNDARDLLLRRIAKELDIPEEKRDNAIKSYESVGEYLGNNISKKVEIFPQGSFRLGTVIKPLSDEDDYDIDFATREYCTINSRENSEVYFTRIDTNKYIINAEIKDFENCVLGNMKNHKSLKLEAIIDFNDKKGDDSHE